MNNNSLVQNNALCRLSYFCYLKMPLLLYSLIYIYELSKGYPKAFNTYIVNAKNPIISLDPFDIIVDRMPIMISEVLLPMSFGVHLALQMRL